MGLFKPNIEKLESKGEVPKLIELLRDDDDSIREKAAASLSRICDSRVIEPFIDVLGERDKSVRANAVETLVKLGTESIEPLIGALGTSYFSLVSSAREDAVEIFKGIGQPAISLLERSVQEGIPSRAAIGVLLDVVGTEGKSSVYGIMVDDDRDYELRALVAEIAGESNDIESAKFLQQAVENDYKKGILRGNAMKSLRTLKENGVIKDVSFSMDDDERGGAPYSVDITY